LNNAKKWLGKTTITQRVFGLLYFQAKKQPKQVGKMPEIRKKISLEAMTTFCGKIRQYP